MSAVFLAAAAGLAGGVVHVLSGPDHLAAVLPFALRDRRAALKVGLTWGLGHGLGVLLLAAFAVIVRSTVHVESFSNIAEAMVGVMLVWVGVWSIRRSRAGAQPSRHHHSVLGFGLLHGLAGASHLFGVLPAVALGRAAAVAYLGTFLGGGLCAMAVFAFAAGRIAIKEALVPRALACAGALSIAVGGFWLFQLA